MIVKLPPVQHREAAGAPPPHPLQARHRGPDGQVQSHWAEIIDRSTLES